MKISITEHLTIAICMHRNKGNDRNTWIIGPYSAKHRKLFTEGYIHYGFPEEVSTYIQRVEAQPPWQIQSQEEEEDFA